MLAALLLNPVMAHPTGVPAKERGPSRLKISYQWPPPGYERNIDQEIAHQEEISQKRPTRAKATKAVDRQLARDLARQEEIRVADAKELIQRRKAEYLAQMARQAVEDEDEDALVMVLLLME